METTEQLALRVAKKFLNSYGCMAKHEIKDFAEAFLSELEKQQEPFGVVLVNTEDEEAVAFYSPDMVQDKAQLKDRFALVPVFIHPAIPQPAAVPDAIAAMNRAKALPVWEEVPHALHGELDVIFRALSAAPVPPVQGVAVEWKNLVGHFQPTASVNGMTVELDDLAHRLKHKQDFDAAVAADLIEMMCAAHVPPSKEGKDAERYQWLRQDLQECQDIFDRNSMGELDAAIDAAMSANKEASDGTA